MEFERYQRDFTFDQDRTLTGVQCLTNLPQTIAQISIYNGHKLADKWGVPEIDYNPCDLIRYPLFFELGVELKLPSPDMVRYGTNTPLFVFFYKLNKAYVVAPCIDKN
jgi:hypothetical protein